MWSITVTYTSRGKAPLLLQLIDHTSVNQDKWIEFVPTTNPGIGIIFYSGGFVEASAGSQYCITLQTMESWLSSPHAIKPSKIKSLCHQYCCR